MLQDYFRLSARPEALPADGTGYVRVWQPTLPPRGSVVIAHGLSEHGGRYQRLAGQLCQARYVVYAIDHRGHGQSVSAGTPLGHIGDRNGWNLLISDLMALIGEAKRRVPGVPVVLLGHSMGSFLAQCVMARHGDQLAGVVLSATSGKPPAIALAGRLIARLERLRLGPRGTSNLLQALSFGAFNKRFEPARTPYDWLSRDAEEVDRYVADPLCGQPASCATWIALLDGIAEAADVQRQAAIPHSMPILALTGRHDPVSAGGRGVDQLLATYASLGLAQVRSKFYAGARHELLNETCRDEVTADLVAFLDACTPA